MKKLVAVIMSVALFAAIAMPISAFAAEKKGDKKKSEEKAKKPAAKGGAYPYRGKVKEISADSLVLEGKDGSRTIALTKATRVQKDGKAAQVGDIKAGDMVSGQVKKSADGKEEAVSLYTGKAPAKKKGGDKKPEKKKSE